ncbi:MAG: hypothetical protein R3261_00120 [Alphaproteobacteria bacterium]|nr:hypothetical protein [Alphaproteobacteria bacterium]
MELPISKQLAQIFQARRYYLSSLIKLAPIIFCLLTYIPTVSANDQIDTVIVYGKKIPFYLDNIDTSPFGVFIKELDKRHPANFKLEILPPNRAQKKFDSGDGDLLLPFPISPHKDEEIYEIFDSYVIPTTSLAKINRHVISLSPAPSINNLSELYGLQLGLVTGYNYAPSISSLPNTTYVYANNQIALMKMLASARVDAILSFPFEARLIAKKLELSRSIEYNPDFIITKADIVMLGHITFRGRKIVETTSMIIDQLRDEGRLDEILASLN